MASRWTVTWGSTLGDVGHAVVAVPGGAVITGSFFDTVEGLGPEGERIGLVAGSSPGPGIQRAFVARLTEGGQVRWTRPLPTQVLNIHPGVATTPDGSVYVAGLLQGTFDFGTEVRTSATKVDVYVLKLSDQGQHLWVRTLPHASQLGEGPALAAAADGSIFVNGRFAADAATPRSPGDLSLARLLPDGSVAWNQRLGDGGLTTVAAVGDGVVVAMNARSGPSGLYRYGLDGGEVVRRGWVGQIEPAALVAAPDGGVVMAGMFTSFPIEADFASAPQREAGVSAGGFDGFVARYRPDLTLDWVRTWGSCGWDRATAVAIAPDGSVEVAGSFVKTIDFDPGPGVDERSVEGAHAVLLSYGPDGTYRGARTWNDPVQIGGLAVGADGTLFGVGEFQAGANFADRPPLDLRVSRGHGDGYLFALEPGSPSGMPGTCKVPAPAAAPIDHRLDGTHLPRTYEECVARTRASICDPNGDGICQFVVGDHEDPALFEECRRVGGAIAVPQGADGSWCSIHYREFRGPCFGGFCI
jgi:hypothetical protein